MATDFLREQRKAVRGTLRALADDKPLFLYSALFDLLFLFMAGTLNTMLVQKLTGIMYLIGGLLSKASLGIARSQSLLELLNAAGAWESVGQFVVLFLVWVIGLYFLYCFFHGLAWRLAYHMSGKPQHLLAFAKRFFRINIRWYALFIVLNVILFVAAYITTSVAKRTEVAVHWSWYLPFLLLLYVALVSYGMMGETSVTGREAWKRAWTLKRRLFPSYLLLLVFFALINLILIGVGYLGPVALVIGGFVLFVPAFTIARVYWLQQWPIK